MRAQRAADHTVTAGQRRAGTYCLPEPLTFTPEDSGTAQAPVVYRAYPGETPVEAQPLPPD